MEWNGVVGMVMPPNVGASREDMTGRYLRLGDDAEDNDRVLAAVQERDPSARLHELPHGPHLEVSDDDAMLLARMLIVELAAQTFKLD